MCFGVLGFGCVLGGCWVGLGLVLEGVGWALGGCYVGVVCVLGEGRPVRGLAAGVWQVFGLQEAA